MISAPDVERAVQTAQPTIRAMNMPPVPVRPIETRATIVSTTVISVMPETGFTPTMAMAWAATGVNRKLSAKPTSAPTTPYSSAWLMV